MADILIRGMEMPKGDLEYVSLWVYGDGRVYVRNKASAASSQRLQDLAATLPAKHGRLIDADAFKTMCLSATKEAKPDFIRHEDWLKSCAITMSFCRDIDEQPTIVPAEGGQTNGETD